MQEIKMVGDYVWIARYELNIVTKVCPVCYGKKQITLILGNDEKVYPGCTYCVNNFIPTGYVFENEYVKSVQRVMIESVKFEATLAEINVQYIFDTNYLIESKHAYETEAEALEYCEILIAEREKNDYTKAEFIKQDKLKSYSWNVGWYKRQIKDAEKKIASYVKKLNACQERVKE
jgi:hypothetical protein